MGEVLVHPWREGQDREIGALPLGVRPQRAAILAGADRRVPLQRHGDGAAWRAGGERQAGSTMVWPWQDMRGHPRLEDNCDRAVLAGGEADVLAAIYL